MFGRYKYRFGRYDLFLPTKIVGTIKRISAKACVRFLVMLFMVYLFPELGML